MSEMLAAGLLGYGAFEFARHQRNVGRLAVRIHVNGTRGKSSVTRLIAGGLSAGGVRTFAKVTGTEPRMILPNGTDELIFRPGPANIIEQLGIMRHAVKHKSDALVIECMALNPFNQRLSAEKMICATAGVITNIRPDHLDVMGPTVRDVGMALCTTIPHGEVVFTAEQELLPLIQEEAAKRRARVVATTPGNITPQMMAGFSYLEHEENVALALAVCAHHGVGQEDALRGMYAAVPDPGVTRVYSIHHHNKQVDFVDCFAANDPESTVMNWKRVKNLFTHHQSWGVLVNTRSDRQSRSEQMGQLIATRMDANFYLVTGDDTESVIRHATHLGLPEDRLEDLGVTQPEVVYQAIAERVQETGLVMGIGNIKNMGQAIGHYFNERGVEYDRGRYWSGVGA